MESIENFYVIIMNMVICTCFLTPKNIFGFNNSLTLPTPGFGKYLEMSVLENFHPDWTILFRTDAPICILNILSNCQLIETIKLLVFIQKQN